MKMKNKDQKERAKEYARRVIEKQFKQTVDEETLESVADKVLKALPNNKELQHA